jgi:hypothetical protein
VPWGWWEAGVLKGEKVQGCSEIIVPEKQSSLDFHVTVQASYRLSSMG